MATPDDVKARVASAYNHAADLYDHSANAFWDRFGRRTVERLRMAPGSSVLDLCCGTGASALPAAEAVGAGGRVVGVDLAEELIRLGEQKASRAGLGNIESAGMPTPSIELEPGVHPVRREDDVKALILGTGYRGTWEQLSAPERQRVHGQVMERIRQRDVTEVRADVLYVTCSKARA